MIGQTVSHYRITNLLGEGGMGVVYAAEDTRLGRRVALKFPTAPSDNESDFYSKFRREARAISALSHPHIAIIYDYGETDSGQPFIVMELIQGHSLGDLLRDGKLPLSRITEIVEQTAEALAEAHRHGVIHRDIKPSNVMINERGAVKVLDFGLAKHFGNVIPDSTVDSGAATLLATSTQNGAIIGTPLYLSPEQAKGTKVDLRSDLFALGAILYEAAAGRHPFAGTNVIEVVAQVLYVDPPPPSNYNDQIPPELDRIALRALSKRAEARYQTADELIADLRAVQVLLPEDDRQVNSNGKIFSEREPLLTSFRPLGSRRTNPAHRLTNETQPRATFSAPVIACSIALFTLVALFALWNYVPWRPTAPYRPTAEAVRWYETGVAALRDGAPSNATRAFERSLQADDRFALAHARLAEAWNELDYTDRAKDSLLRIQSFDERTQLSARDRLYLDAVRATATRDFTRAVAAYRELANLEPNTPSVHFDLGRAYERADNFADALASYRRATELDTQYAAAFLRAGILYGRQSSMTEAAAAFERAESLYRDLGNTEGLAETVYQRGVFLNNLGRVTDAHAQFQSALDIARATTNDYQQIRAMSRLSDVLTTEGNATQAEASATEALNLARRQGMDNLIASSLIYLGNVFLGRGDFADAERYFRQSLETARHIGARRGEAWAQLSLGSLHINQGNTDDGAREVEQSLVYYQQGGYSTETWQALLLLGRVNRNRGDYAAALRVFNQQLQLAERLGDQSQAAFAHGEIGNVLSAQENYLEALSHYDESQRLHAASGAQLYVSYSLSDRAHMLWSIGRYEEAHAALSQAIAIIDRSGADYRDLLALIRLQEAHLALSQNQFPQSIRLSHQAIVIAAEQSNSLVARAKMVLGLAQTFSGSTSLGRQTCAEAVVIATRSGNPLLIASAQLALAEALVESGDLRGARDLAMRARDSFAAAGRRDSEWRACLVLARSCQNAGDRQEAEVNTIRARTILAQLQQQWGAEVFNAYLARPDIQLRYPQLGDALSAAQ